MLMRLEKSESTLKVHSFRKNICGLIDIEKHFNRLNLNNNMGGVASFFVCFTSRKTENF
ncbi:hypothetical protein VIBNISO65_800018 [Vibrio nigripulchritudo SO65]|nr:hypothetical protein VIBNIAM115_1440032 [Vibrio nigripulchritudo AM115]CCN44063.1 hypothetical protein VIBNIFTn2_700018 [Vibrio nigripulchritudo FTn2]CCN64261.1 hypothetical protein VIBNIPon4_200018 [Vibrio nigripulchritudo POn4]CCN79036.1 hypothetical protein VIBNISO65_800018 [Vibrio nigripulchritudo SO65]